MSEKIKVNKNLIMGSTIYDLVFLIQQQLMALVSYQIASVFQRQILKCKNSLEMLGLICKYADIR